MKFIYFSTLAWDEAAGAHNPTQIARALARQGHAVLFVEPQPSRTREETSQNYHITSLTELGMSPMQLRRAWFGLESGDLEQVAQTLLKLVDASDTEARAAIFSAPFDPYVRSIPFLRAHHFEIVYYAMDDFAAAPALGYTQFNAGAEDYLTRESDLLCGVTPSITQSLERFGASAEVIPNGVEREMWQIPNSTARAPNIVRGELTLGFWGTLMESMFDADLIAHVAQSRPRWTIHLLGAIDPELHRSSIAARLKPFPNIFFHGAVPHDALPVYAKSFDVGLVPFPDNAFSRGRDPIKVYEYLAAHLPVAASYTPQLSALPSVFVGSSPTEFISAIECAARTPMDLPALDSFLAQQTWDARVTMLLDLLRTQKTSAPHAENGTILASFAHPDAAAVMRYAMMLEKELNDVQAWAQELERNAQSRTMLDRFKQWGNRKANGEQRSQ